MKKLWWLLTVTAFAVAFNRVSAEDIKSRQLGWPQFRGPNGWGIAADDRKLPVQFGLDSHMLWKTPLPEGNSSACLWGEKVFVTAFHKQEQLLETLCLDRITGRIVWRRQAPPVAKIETSLHPANGPATPTPATDGQHVYVYFGSFGLLAYDMDGNEQWHKPLPVPGTTFGSGSSPILAGELLLLACQGKDAGLLAVQRQTGATVWKKDRLRFGIGYSTPLLRQSGAVTQVILVQPRGVTAYDAKDGAEIWSIGGLFGGGIPSPASGDELLFAVAYFPGGESGDPLKFPDFDELLKKYDANKDGQLGEKEVPADLVFYDRGSPDPKDNITMEDMFPSIDKDRDGKLSRQEWQDAIARFAKIESALVAIRPNGKGELGKEQLAWKGKRALPEVPSPLWYQGRLYLVKNGGIASCYEASSGKLLYRERLGAGGFFYASPVAGDGKIYAASYDGVVVVFAAGDQCRLLARNRLGEPIVATPALAQGRLYVRTKNYLYAFGS